MFSYSFQPPTSSNVLTVSALLVSLYCVHRLQSSRSRLPLPPGPPKLPFVGNIFNLPSFPEWETYAKWGIEYESDIIHVDAAGTSFIVLNSVEAVTDLLEKRSKIYSSRPQSPMVCELMGWSWNLGFMRYGDQWRRRRRAFLEIFHAKAARDNFHPQQLKVTRNLMHRLLKSPLAFHSHLQHHAASIVLNVAYGLDIKEKNDPYIKIADAAMHPLLVALVPGAYLVDSFTWLKHIPSWFPGAGFKKDAALSKELATKMVNKPFEDGRILAEQHDVPSFLHSALQKAKSRGNIAYEEEVIRDAAAAMYLAGSDTTVSALRTFLLAMMFAPETQVKAQEELDRVLDHGQLPDFSDEESLPYVTALVKESLRWNNITPMALAHAIEVEDEYRGYRIPANSLVFGNVWAILHDENLYPEPLLFKPERYIVDGKLSFEKQRDPTFASFGFGRRICPGRHMAYSSVWIAVASILRLFTISKPVDKDGRVVEPTYRYQTGLVTSPEPFECNIQPRSAATYDMLKFTKE